MVQHFWLVYSENIILLLFRLLVLMWFRFYGEPECQFSCLTFPMFHRSPSKVNSFPLSGDTQTCLTANHSWPIHNDSYSISFILQNTCGHLWNCQQYPRFWYHQTNLGQISFCWGSFQSCLRDLGPQFLCILSSLFVFRSFQESSTLLAPQN